MNGRTRHSLDIPNHSRTKEYRAWVGMIDRCYDNKYSLYHRYGGRGIKVCKRWLNSYSKFLSDMGECPKGKSLDRVNNNGNYKPSNCRWATVTEQSNNRSTNILFTIDGVTKNLSQWCIDLSKDYQVVWARISRGANIEDALSAPVLSDGRFKQGHQGTCVRAVIDGETGIEYPTIKIAAKKAGFSRGYMYDMLNGRATNKTTFRLK